MPFIHAKRKVDTYTPSAEIDGEICLRLDTLRKMTYVGMFEMVYSWRQEAAKLKAGGLPRGEYGR